GLLVPTAPWLSVAAAVIVYVPAVTPVNVALNGAVVSLAVMMPPSEKSTRDTVPSESEALAVTVIVAGGENVAPGAGLVIETAGSWLSEPVHATPLSEQLVGGGLLPGQLPLNPIP